MNLEKYPQPKDFKEGYLVPHHNIKIMNSSWGSPELEKKGKVPFGRLSGIVAHYVPNYLQKNRMPSWETNCIEDWETKLEKIIDETINEDMRLISGIPPWVQMYFERIEARTGKEIKDVFPNFSLFVQGGVNYKPYQPIFDKLVGKRVPTIEVYPASEGFIAFQDSQSREGLLLNVDAGIFFEFIPEIANLAYCGFSKISRASSF